MWVEGGGSFSHCRPPAASNLLNGLNKYISNSPSTFPPATIKRLPQINTHNVSPSTPGLMDHRGPLRSATSASHYGEESCANRPNGIKITTLA